ncbi:MAG: hypothetical protein KAH48_02240 [Chlorobi bacterium]|nr:hypothetical protein [Chlorobiota bacterium]
MNRNSSGDQKRTKKVVISFTPNQYRELSTYCEANALRPSTFIFSETVKFLRKADSCVQDYPNSNYNVKEC